MVPGSGTLVINATLAARLQGRFRCFATNALGTAVSPEANVIAESERPPQPSQTPRGSPPVHWVPFIPRWPTQMLWGL